MDISALFGLLPPRVQALLPVALGLSWLAGQFCALTPTPSPDTPWGRVYRVLEVIGGIWGRAKQSGLPAAAAKPPGDPLPPAGAVLAVILTLSATACSSAPDARSELLSAETAFEIAVTAAEVYSALPDCGGGQTLCSDPAIKADMTKAIASARIAFAQAEIAILGCPAAQWRASQTNPPTASCGTPVTDLDAQGQMLAAARAALITATAVVPMVQQP